MYNLKNEELVILVFKTIPYPSHISKLGLGYPDQIRFDWRQDSFKVDKNLSVGLIDGPILCSDNKSILLEALLKSKQQSENN